MASAAAIDLRLEIDFSNPNNPLSGGEFLITIKTSAPGGVAGLAATVSGVSFAGGSEPSLVDAATYSWLDPIATNDGLVSPILNLGGGVAQFVLAQDPSLPAEQLVFGIGTGAGTPGNRPVDPFGLGFTNSAIVASGVFAAGDLPTVGPSGGNVYAAVGEPTASLADVTTIVVGNAIGVAGDYNGDGLVTASDYDVWATAFGSTNHPIAQASGNGVVGAADYAVWRDNSPPANSLSLNTVEPIAVPEPGGVLLAWVAACMRLSSPPRRRGVAATA